MIDRVKNVFKLAQGEFVCAEQLENQYISECSLISQIYIHGDSKKSSIIAVIVPNIQSFITTRPDWPLDEAEAVDEDSIFNSKRLKSHLRQEIKKQMSVCGKKLNFQSYQLPKHFILEKNGFTPENNLLTATMKLARNNLLLFYGEKFAKIYEKLSSLENNFLVILKALLHGKYEEIKKIRFDTSLSLQEIGIDSLGLLQIQSSIGFNLPAHLLLKNLPVSEIFSFLHSKFHSGGSVPFSELFCANGETLPLANTLSVDFPSENEREIETNTSAREYTLAWSNEFASNEDAAHFDKNIHLEPLLFPSPASQEEQDVSRSEQGLNILLTGASGFLGVEILFQLLEHYRGQANVTFLCLIRENTIERGAKRLLEQLRKARKQIEGSLSENRIEILLGDLSRYQLGLNDADFIHLAKRVDVIYHSGAFVNWLCDYRLARLPNFLGTLELLRLAISTPPGKEKKRFYFISTIGVTSECSENLPLSFEYFEHLLGWGGYSASKFMAEYFVRAICSKFDVPFIIFRPGMITSHSSTGFFNEFDFVNRLFQFCLQSGFFIDVKNQFLDMTPVDYITDAIIRISTVPVTHRVFHLVNPLPLSYSQIGEALNACLLEQSKKPLVLIAYPVWRKKLLDSLVEQPPETEHLLAPLLNYFPVGGLIEFLNYSCSNTASALPASFFDSERNFGLGHRTFVNYLFYLQNFFTG